MGSRDPPANPGLHKQSLKILIWPSTPISQMGRLRPAFEFSISALGCLLDLLQSALVLTKHEGDIQV